MMDLILSNSFFLYFLIFIVIMLEYANAPLPSELVLPLSGALVIPFELNIFMVLFISVLGGIIGSLINYYLGLKFGKSIVYWTINKFPKSKKSFDASYNAFNKYQKSSVFISRLIPIARTVISIVAGTLKMNCFEFTAYSSVGIFIWNFILIIGGYAFYDNLDIVMSIISTYSLAIKLALLALLLFLIIKKLKERKNAIKKPRV